MTNREYGNDRRRRQARRRTARLEPDKNCLITISGSQTVFGMTGTISLSLFGEYRTSGGRTTISFREAAPAGIEGALTTVTVDGGRIAVVERTGRAPSRLIMEKGQRHLCHYETGNGNFMVGVKTDQIENKLGDEGGVVKLRYTLDIGMAALSHNQLDISVERAARNRIVKGERI